jgi:hypothetical protein
MSIIRRTLDIDADTDARLREMVLSRMSRNLSSGAHSRDPLAHAAT